MTYYAPLLLYKLWDQIILVSFSTLIAIILGVPLGIAAVKIPQTKNWIYRFVNIFQTIPSLALLAFFVPLLGIGVLPAIITMSLYAFLPIVANTQTALDGVPKAQIEAADSLGFTAWQKLRIVELPLALPFMIAGMRTAAVMNVSIATIAAYIGAGGLGDFIFQGIATSNINLVLLGAIPIALLALTVDWVFRKLEARVLTRHAKKNHRLTKWLASTALFILFIGSIPFLHGYKKQSRDNQVIIATKNFTEQLIIGHLVAELLKEHTNLDVVKKFNLGATDVCHQAMLKGEIDIYPEYTGTAYLHVLKKPFETLCGKELFEEIKNDYQSRFNIIWCPPLGFDNSTVLAHSNAIELSKPRTLTDLKQFAKHAKLGAPAEFYSRPDGYQCLKNHYLIEFKQVVQMDPIFMYEAVKNHEVDFIFAFSTSPQIQHYGLLTLEDDKNVFPKYDAAILVRQHFTDQHPEILEILKKLSNSIDNSTMQSLNYKVDILKESPKQVAESFLIENNFFY